MSSDTKAAALLAPGTDIWEGRTKPSVFFMDAALPPGRRSADRPEHHQVIVSKDGNGEYRDDAVFGIRGCIAAVRAAYRRQSGRPITMNALAESLAAAAGANVTAASVSKTLSFMDEGRILTFDRARGVAELLGVDVLDVVGTLLNVRGARLQDERAAREMARLAAFRLPMRRVGPGDVAWLAESLACKPALDLEDELFFGADQPGWDAANRALDLVRAALRLWRADGGLPTSRERGAVSAAIAELEAVGLHAHVGRLARLRPLTPDDFDAASSRVLVVRFSPEAGLPELPWPREAEYGLSIDDDDDREQAIADLAWAGQAGF